MARHPAFTQGTITGKRPENRNHVTYTFVVGGNTYNAEGAVGDAYESIAIGATVPVVYDPKNPDVSSIYDPAHPNQWHVASPEQYFVQAAIMTSVFSLISGLIVTFSLWQMAKRHGFVSSSATEQIVGRERREREPQG